MKMLIRQSLLFFLISAGFNSSVAQSFMPTINRNNSIQKDTSDHFFKEIWLKSKDISNENIPGFLERAGKKMEMGYYTEAIEDIDKTIKLDSTISYSYTLMGLCKLRQDSANIAFDLFSKAQKLDTSEVLNYLYLAQIYTIRDKYQVADSLYQICITKNPELTDAYFGMANLAFYNKKYKQAEKLYKKVIDIDPNYTMAYFNLAVYYSYISYDKSIRYLGKVIDVSPDFAPAYYYRGFLKMFHFYDEKPTLKDWNKAIELDSTNALYRASKGFISIYAKRYDEAMAEFIQVQKMSKSENFSSDFEKSPDAQRAADFNEQVSIYRKNLDKFSGDQQSQLNKALCLFYSEDYEQADRIYSALLKTIPAKGLICFFKGYNLTYRTWYGDSEVAFEEAFQQPDFPLETYLRAGANYMFLEKYPEAIKMFSTFIKQNDSVKFAYRSRGISYVQVQKYDSALADFDQFLKLDSTESDIYFNRAVCYKAKQDFIKAIANFDLTMKYSPKKVDMESAVLRAECSYILGDTAESLRFLCHTFDSAKWLSDEGHLLLGQVFLDYKKYDSAIVHFNFCTRFNNNDFDVFMLRGKAYYLKSDFQNAVNDFTRALNMNDNDMNAHYARALALIKMNDKERAYKDFEKAGQLGHPLAKRAINTFLKDYQPPSN